MLEGYQKKKIDKENENLTRKMMIRSTKFVELLNQVSKMNPKIVEFLESKKGVIMIIEISKERL